jgi:hypothetical protein
MAIATAYLIFNPSAKESIGDASDLGVPIARRVLPVTNDIHQPIGAGERFRHPAFASSPLDIVMPIVGKKDLRWFSSCLLRGDSIDLRIGFHALGFKG